MKKENILVLILALGGLFIIGKTIYNSHVDKVENLEYRLESLQEYTELQGELIDSITSINFLLMDYYCCSENLMDTIFTNFVTKGILVFEYEPYVNVSNKIFDNEQLYEYLECKRNEL